MQFLPIIIAAIVVFSIISLILIISGVKHKRASSSSEQKNRQTIIREATKKLSQDPHNVSGLLSLSELYYKEQLWDKAFPLFDTLLGIAVAHPEVDIFSTSLKQGICALKNNKLEESFKGLIQARKLQPDNFEVNFYLGQAFYLNKEYDKAIPLLKKAIAINKEVQDTYKYVGLALYKYHSFRESLPYIKRTLDLNPDDKELLFAMVDAMNEGGSGEKALKIFMHLRPDPEFGARSCLAAGIIHANQNQHDKAILDFEIGLKHTQAPVDILTNIRYRLSHSYLALSDISRALSILKEIQQTVPGFKDVQSLIARYQELTQNANLQIYLISSNSDFIALCRKIVQIYFGKAFVKILDIAATNECTEVQAEIDTPKWQDSVVFRFYRTTGSTGELFVREFHARIRDLKVGRGLCFTAGTYTEEARKFIEGRPIDLIDKSGLIKILNKIDAKNPF